jgi:hypothetical protein
MSVYELGAYMFPNRTEPKTRISKSVQSSQDNPLNMSNMQTGNDKSYILSRYENKYEQRSSRVHNNNLQKNQFSFDPLKLSSVYASDVCEYNPWGKPGNGAPIQTTRYGGSLRTDMLNNVQRPQFYSANNSFTDNKNHQAQKVDLFSELEARSQQRRIRPETTGDFVSWMNSFESQHLKSKPSLLHTNVTREKVNSESIRNHPTDYAKNYSTVLAGQSEEADRRRKLEKLKHLAADEEHIKNYNSWVSIM